MSGFEHSPYEILPQRDGGLTSPPVYNNVSTNGVPRSDYQVGSRSSFSKTESISVKSRNSASKLGPKSFSKRTASRRVWMHVLTATATLVLVAIPLSLVAVVITTSSLVNRNDQGVTYCSKEFISLSCLSAPRSQLSTRSHLLRPRWKFYIDFF